jgi:hypothetical protein
MSQELVFILMMLGLLALGALQLLEAIRTRFMPDDTITSTRPAHPADEAAQPTRAQTTATEATNAIATPQTEHNQPVVDCDAIAALARSLNEDPTQTEAAVMTLARLCNATRKTRKGDVAVLGETDAIRYGLGIAPGSNTPKYDAAKAALAAERQRQRNGVYRELDAEQRPVAGKYEIAYLEEA